MQVPNLGLRSARLLLSQSGVENPDDLFRLSIPDILRIDGFGKEKAVSLTQFDNWKKVDRILEITEKTNAKIVSQNDLEYPDLLKQIYDPPLLLWVKGDTDALKKQGMAVVGTRNPGKYGLDQAEKWTLRLIKSGMSVVSGLAYGIDAKSHKTAIQNGGPTVAVMGSGIDWIYPNKNSKLADQMIEKGGAVITEYPPGTKPDACHFPERNRIVSGMSHGVLVVESGIKGGSMITARAALDQNREVFVIPHPLDYLKGEGCNYLIRTGQGKLIQSLDDILDEISVNVNGKIGESVEIEKSGWRDADLEEEQQQICRLLEKEVLHIDNLAEKLQTNTFKLLPTLLELEMKGVVRQKAGKYFELE